MRLKQTLAALLALALAACASAPALREYPLASAQVELAQTPFFPQADFQCGPAALATLLTASEVDVLPDTLTPLIYLPGRQGSLQPELLATTRRYDRVPYVLEPKLSALLAELDSGRPVLVLQNLGLRAWPQWHYAVVIGYDRDADTLLLRSGTEPRQTLQRRRFETTWAYADRWALIAASPDAIPVTATATGWIATVSAFEALDKASIAERGYRTATARWPDVPLAWQALANSLYTQDKPLAAEAALQEALALKASAATHHNLALLLLERGCPTQARSQLTAAHTATDAAPYAGVLARAHAKLQASPPTDAPDCPR